MSKSITLALDGMGGDDAPDIVLDGIALARKRHPDVRYILFGDEAILEPLLEKRYRGLRNLITVVHTPDVVTNNDKPSVALRNGRNSSMAKAIKAVKDGQADGVISAGNTGALMAMSKLTLRTLPGIDRPAIAALMPTQRGESVVLDLGANTECNANNLVEFALMGTLFARSLLDLDMPTVGLLNIGEEEQKGRNEVKEAASILRENAGLVNFAGFVEGDDIGIGTVDVVVTDGFTGNVALKTMEGTAKVMSRFLKEAFKSSILAQIGYLLARPAMNRVRHRTDPRRYNGAMFLGLNGIVVKSHGGTDGLGFANAIGVAVDMVRHGFNERINDELKKLHSQSVTAEVQAI
ncbi:phosphate acyltransferase PlsX [Oleispirillum naphthae]|uniref:phosphate acyltransferase PlsX n=1 Tax=Oleispirillum naphthae TaxID=2838853 RepID=UPI0030823AF8